MASQVRAVITEVIPERLDKVDHGVILQAKKRPAGIAPSRA